VNSKGRYRPGTLERIRTRDGWCWYVRFQATVNGVKTRTRQRVGLEKDFPNKSAVWRSAQGLVDEFNKVPELTRAVRRRFNELIDRYIAEEMPIRYSTQKGYKAIIRNQIRPAWGNEFLDEVTPLRVRAWLKGLACSSRYRGHIHGLMRILFRFAMLWEWIPFGENPMSLFRVEGSTRRMKEPQVLTAEQFGAVLEQIEEPAHRTAVLVAACLGLRCSELFALKWSDVGKDTIRIDRAIIDGRVGGVKTIHSRKPLPLHADLAAALLEFRSKTEFNKDDDWIFASPWLAGERPYRPNNVQSLVLVPAGKKAGLPFQLGWHTFRHTYKTWLEDLEVPLTVQRDLMRHADIRTTAQVYGQVGMKTLRAANDRLIVMPIAESRKARKA
jgi:integrase